MGIDSDPRVVYGDRVVAHPAKSRPHPMRIVGLVGALGVTLSITMAAWFWIDARRLDQVRFEAITHRLTEDLDAETEKVEGMLRTLARVIGAEWAPSETTWDEFINQISPRWNLPGVVCIGYATNHSIGRVMGATELLLRRSEPEARATFYGMTEPWSGPRQWSAWIVDFFHEGVIPTALFSRQKLSISWREKSFQMLRMHGSQQVTFEGACPFLWGGSPMQAPGLVFNDRTAGTSQDAVARDEVQIHPDLFLLQTTNAVHVPQATMIAPVSHPRRDYRDALTTQSGNPNELFWRRWQFNAGLVFACVDFGKLVSQIQGNGPSEVGVEIYSRDLRSQATGSACLNPGQETLRQAAGLEGGSTLDRWDRWPMYGQGWGLYFYTTPLFDQHSTVDRAWWAGAMGISVTALFCWALAVQTRGRMAETQRASELNEARNALQGVQRERERLSHDLHDGAIQSLYAIQLGLTRTGLAVESLAPDAAKALQESRGNLDVVIGELREFLHSVKRDETQRPAVGLEAVLESLVRRLRPASSAPITVDCDAAVSAELTSGQAVQMAAIAREALSNSLRHAQAREIAVRLFGVDSRAILEVGDDGIGFDSRTSDSGGMGMKTLRRRAEDLGATLTVHSGPGQGTRIRVEVPFVPGSGPEDGHG